MDKLMATLVSKRSGVYSSGTQSLNLSNIVSCRRQLEPAFVTTAQRCLGGTRDDLLISLSFQDVTLRGMKTAPMVSVWNMTSETAREGQKACLSPNLALSLG